MDLLLEVMKHVGPLKRLNKLHVFIKLPISLSFASILKSPISKTFLREGAFLSIIVHISSTK